MVSLILGAFFWIVPTGVWALCDVIYKVQPGDTLFSIATQHFDDRDKWTLIYYSNQSALIGAGQAVEAGQNIYIPCPVERSKPDATPLRQDDAMMVFLTGGNYAPFSDQSWPGGGMVTELINAALELSPSPVPYSVAWEDDWSTHLFPLLDDKTYDMGFPWLKPDCQTEPENERCANFHFSDPLVDLPIMLFKRAESGFTYDSDVDVLGQRLCRPVGYFTHDLDHPVRRWLSGAKISLVQADSPEACFEQLMAGNVDLVSVNVFLGAAKITAMGLSGQVVVLDKPLSQEGLHAVISKTHWRGTTHLYRINAGLKALHETGRYNEIVTRHLGIFWDQLK